ncbi:hypothetical protein [Winogradskyella flava]|uniref:Uncharacterized protein n=1 Tax=Winogradskyella flava TaxID=1884876 RepID=A0A842IM23_9FLAO|nr:hypothetical protein [Winogradskyella flava]MBC2843685.1 hypothetical protein [Winogradskyella flava]
MAKVNWKNHIREFVVVVFGILLAFQLDRCASDNNKQKLVDEHVNYIKEETRLNVLNLKYSIQLSESNFAKIDSIINLISKKGDVSTINKLSFEIFNVGYLYIRRNAYNSLVNSGDIRFIKSFEEKKNIINMYEYYTWTESLDQGCRAAYFDDFFPYVKENFDLVTSMVQDPEIYYSKTFSNALSTYRFALDLKIKKFKDCEKEINDFLKVINQNQK